MQNLPVDEDNEPVSIRKSKKGSSYFDMNAGYKGMSYGSPEHSIPTLGNNFHPENQETPSMNTDLLQPGGTFDGSYANKSSNIEQGKLIDIIHTQTKEKQEMRDQIHALRHEIQHLKGQQMSSVSSSQNMNDLIHKNKIGNDRYEKCLEKISELYSIITAKDQQLQKLDQIKKEKQLISNDLITLRKQMVNDIHEILNKARQAE